MSITVGSLTITQHQQLPFTHGGDSTMGQTARRWPVQAILTPAEWLTLDGIYNTWRTARLADPDTMVSLSVGSTVNTSGKLWGMTWTDVAAWFTAPPTPSAAGAMVSVSFELTDAAQMLTAMLRNEAINTELQDNESTYGTYTLGSVTINLTGALEGFEEGPNMDLAATGTHVIRGPLTASRLKRIQGWTHTVGADAAIRSWYLAAISVLPSAGDWFPITPPVIDQTPVIVNGARLTRYLVSIDLKQVL